MNQAISILIIAGGGLGTFLLGMKHLSEGLQAVSGSGLRRFMSIATTHRLAGVGTGVLSTVIVQSSSIITVMAVGFVSSGLMSLSQANSHDIGGRIHDARRNQLERVGPDDPDSPVRVLAELDILNAYERIRACYINVAETLAGRK